MLKAPVLLLFFFCLAPFLTGNAQKNLKNGNPHRPNIIFILTDDQRWDALGFAGNSLVHTPEMDKLAKTGAYFPTAIVTTPICAASRATLFTGLYERTHGYNFQTSAIREDFMKEAYPKLLRDAGYYTGFFGKFGVRYDHKEKLFDQYEEYDRNNSFKDQRGYFYKILGQDTVHLTRYTGQQALDFLEAAPGERPFCLSLSFSAPHAHDPAEAQYFWQPETAHLLEETKIPEPALADDSYFNKLPEMVREGFNRTRWHWRYDNPEKYQHSVKGYYRMISGIDLEIGKIRKKLEEKGLAENTVIILMGDNGYFLGERQLAGKWLLYDNSIRVPLIIFDPRTGKAVKSDRMVLNVDVPSTILDLAGIQPPSQMQGQSLVSLIDDGKDNLNRDTVLIEHLWEFEHIPPSEGVRTSQWKYFRYINDQSIEELYDLQKDPHEINNLAGQKKFQKTLVNLREKCNTLIGRFQDTVLSVPQNLMVEFIRKPAKIPLQDQKPEFSWTVPAGAKLQKGYQILVASSRDLIEQNIGDVWESGQVRSSTSTNVEFRGKPLDQGARYYWKVRIWAELNRLSPYSEVQSFTIAEHESSMITTRNIFQVDTIAPMVFRQENNQLFIDFGKAAFGTVMIRYNSPRKEVLTVRLGEQLSGKKINRDPQGHIRYQEVKLPVEKGKKQYLLKLPADERNTKPEAVALPDSFPVIMPFRYCEIEGASGNLNAEAVKQLSYHTYFEEKVSHFSSSDTILNQIWDLCKYTMKATSFAGLYVDGDRERIPYEADAYINQLSHYAVDPEYPIARATIEYFMEYPTWPTEWQLHMALLFYQDYMYTGNSELIQKYYDALKHKTLMELAREDGLISSARATPEFMRKLGFKDPNARLKDIVDWPPAQKDTGWQLATEEGERDGYVFRPINTVINSLYYQNLLIMAEFAAILEKEAEAEEFRIMALQVKKMVNEKLFNSEKGIYTDGEGTDHSSLHANMMPLAFGMVPAKFIPTVVEFIKSRGMACSVYGAQYLMDGLYDAGAADYALELMTATHDRSWWNMIEIGSTMTLEAWDMKYKPNADWNHAWGAVPGNVIARKMWGITPKTPGASVVEIKPQLAGLNFSNIGVPFINGVVNARFERKGNRNQIYEIGLPANVSAEFKLKFSSDDTVTVNGEEVNTAFGTIRLSPGMNRIELTKNSF